MDPLDVLAVCTGNICRSALTEYYLKNSLDGDRFIVHSAGTHAVQDGHVPPPQVAIAHRLGLTNITDHIAQQISRAQILKADLILTATLQHRRRVVRMAPSAAKYTFTLREFAHLSSRVEENDVVELMANGVAFPGIPAAAAHQLRGLVTPPKDKRAYDVVDPFGADAQTYDTSATQILSALQVIVPYLEKVASITGHSNTSGAKIRGKHSYDPLDPEQSDIREQITARMREQRASGESPTRRRRAPFSQS
ncbi:MAG: hypothetical protein QM705_10505 [Ancrocorticia sp.]